jgi:hypothetical protein
MEGYFDFQDIDSLKLPDRKSGISVLLMGSTRAGKTTMLKFLYETVFKNYITVLHTASAHNDTYLKMKKTVACATTYHPELINETYKINKKTDSHYEFLHILDDVVDKKNDAELKKLLTIYRNSRISGVITGQSLTIFNSITRGNINYVFLGYLNSDAAVEQAIKSYLTSYFPTKMRMADKIKAYRELTSDYFWIVLDSIHGDVFRTKLRPDQLEP